MQCHSGTISTKALAVLSCSIAGNVVSKRMKAKLVLAFKVSKSNFDEVKYALCAIFAYSR